MGVQELRGEQLRAARALLRWSQKKLADEASKISPVSSDTIKRWEAIDGVVNATTTAVSAVVRTIEKAGVELLNDGQPGARLVRTNPSATEG
ncbi:helix-turn-helix domain-containing protein [Azospirillum argentinense]|uniref:helix-turn-helix domain-containing protein n=1 Tax=Azospirillum argentinense TaxID=2970906 RepID=UPI0032DFB5AD